MTSYKPAPQLPVPQLPDIISLPHLPMTTESKQTSPLHVPRFTPADYGSFFLAGQFLL
jgi:hypothetical protein